MKLLALTVLSGLLALTASSQTTKPKPKPKTAAVSPAKKAAAPAKKPLTAKKPSPPRASEGTEWEKANALTDPVQRVAALKKFIKTFPRSEHFAEAAGLLINAEAGLGNDKLAAGDVDAAIVLYKAAVKDAPAPVPAGSFSNF